MIGAAFLAIATPQAHAITPQSYSNVGVSVPANAALPLDSIVTDDSGERRPLRLFMSRSTVLVFADYTCTTLCGPIVAFVAAALEQSGLKGDQYRLLVIGLDPKDSAADAASMRHDHLGDDASLNAASTFLTTDQRTLQSITSALGYRFLYDDEHDQYIHRRAARKLLRDGCTGRARRRTESDSRARL